MLAFIRANLGLILVILLSLAAVLGGIWWVEASLAGQEVILS